jgi:hypothetical protein
LSHTVPVGLDSHGNPVGRARRAVAWVS